MQTKRNPSEGLRRFAQTYRNTLQGQLGVEKYRSASKTAKKPVDPRFRRIRTLPQGETTITKSETKVPSPFHPPRAVPTSLPTVSSMPSSPRPKARSPRARLAERVSLSKTESRTSAENTSAQADTLHSQTFEQPRERCLQRVASFVERSERKRGHRTTPSRTESRLFETNDAGTVMSSNRVEPASVEDDQSDRNKRAAQVPFGDHAKNLATYIAPPLEIKPTKEAMAKSDVATPEPADDNRCMCIACARVFQRRSGELDEFTECDCNSSNAGTRTMIRTIESMTHADYQEGDMWREPVWLTWCLNALGCFCGLLLVSCVVWVLSNRIVWDWFFVKREPPPPKPTTVWGFLNYCAAALVFSVNVVAKAVYAIITLPRSILFPSSDDDVGESRWSL